MSNEQIPAPGTIRSTLIRTPLGVLLSIAVAGVGFYLLVNHTGHVLTALPYLFLLACPLMHVIMHHAHDKTNK